MLDRVLWKDLERKKVRSERYSGSGYRLDVCWRSAEAMLDTRIYQPNSYSSRVHSSNTRTRARRTVLPSLAQHSQDSGSMSASEVEALKM